MLIISQNLTNYDVPIPKNAIFRVNLAWCNSIDELKKRFILLLLDKEIRNNIIINHYKWFGDEPTASKLVDKVLQLV